MIQDELTLIFASLELIYPPRPRFTGSELPRLYAALSERHTFEDFGMTGDESALMSTEGVNEVEVARDHIMLEEHLRSLSGIDQVKTNFSDIVGVVMEHLHIDACYEPQIALRALWPVPIGEQETAIDKFRNGALKINDDQFDLLGEGELVSLGLRLQFDLEDGTHTRLEVSPYIGDERRLSIEFNTWKHHRLETASVLEEWIAEAYDHFMNKSTTFITSIIQ